MGQGVKVSNDSYVFSKGVFLGEILHCYKEIDSFIYVVASKIVFICMHCVGI
jgi:hypothetical protein